MAICTKCERIDAHVHTEDLTSEECYALAFAQACAAGKNSPAMKSFLAAEVKLSATVSASARTNLRQRGLKGLADRGIVTLKRTGLGEWEPVTYDGSKLVGGQILVGDFS